MKHLLLRRNPRFQKRRTLDHHQLESVKIALHLQHLLTPAKPADLRPSRPRTQLRKLSVRKRSPLHLQTRSPANMVAKNPRRSNPSRSNPLSSCNLLLRRPRKTPIRKAAINRANPNKRDAPITTWTPSFPRSPTKRKTKFSKPSRTTSPLKQSSVWRRRNPFPKCPDRRTPPVPALVKVASETSRFSKLRWLRTTSRSITAKASSSPQRKQPFLRKRPSSVARLSPCRSHPHLPPSPAAPR